MAKKHIEVNELKEWVENFFYQHRFYHPYSKSNDIPVPELYDILERMPAADVAEVGHYLSEWCTDCKEYDKERHCCPRFNRVIEETVAEMKSEGWQKVRHGRWEHYAHIEPQYDINGVKTWGEAYQCSNCGFIHSVIENFGHYAYCPNCGSRMVDEE